MEDKKIIKLYLRHKYLNIEKGIDKIQIPIEAVELIVDMFNASNIKRHSIQDNLYCKRKYEIHYELQHVDAGNRLSSVNKTIIREPNND